MKNKNAFAVRWVCIPIIKKSISEKSFYAITEMSLC